jgi:hypothetical protein
MRCCIQQWINSFLNSIAEWAIRSWGLVEGSKSLGVSFEVVSDPGAFLSLPEKLLPHAHHHDIQPKNNEAS